MEIDQLNEKVKNIISYWQKKEPFKSIEDIPSITHFNEDIIPEAKELQEWIQNRLIELGAIAKDKLIKGHTYSGSSRNSSIAKWLGNRFEYVRYKFGCKFKRQINHFQDDNGYDIFVPLIDITENESNS